MPGAIIQIQSFLLVWIMNHTLFLTTSPFAGLFPFFFVVSRYTMSIHSYFDFFIFHRVYFWFIWNQNNDHQRELQCAHLGGWDTENPSSGGSFASWRFYIYDMRSAVIMSQSPFPSTTPLNATRSRPRRLAPDPLGRGQYENGTKHPLIVRNCDG